MKRSRMPYRRSKPRPNRVYGAEMKDLRQQCWDRDEGQCRHCGILTFYAAVGYHPRNYEMAHIRSRGAGGADELSNLKTLCSLCHKSEHAGGKPVPKKVP